MPSISSALSLLNFNNVSMQYFSNITGDSEAEVVKVISWGYTIEKKHS